MSGGFGGIWDVQESSGPYTLFGELEVISEERASKKGSGSWYHITLSLYPIGGGEVVTRKQASFNHEWNRIFLPSMHQLVREGKIGHPQEVNGAYVRIVSSPWRDSSKNTVEYYERENPERVTIDPESGQAFVSKLGWEIVDIYSDKETCRLAYNAFAEEHGLDPVEEDVLEAAFVQGTLEGATAALVEQFLPALVRAAVDAGTNKVDRTRLRKALEANPAFNGLTLDSDLVQKAIAEVDGPPF